MTHQKPRIRSSDLDSCSSKNLCSSIELAAHERRRDALDELVRLSEEMGLYDLPNPLIRQTQQLQLASLDDPQRISAIGVGAGEVFGAVLGVAHDDNAIELSDRVLQKSVGRQVEARDASDIDHVTHLCAPT